MPRDHDDGIPIRTRRKAGLPVLVIVATASSLFALALLVGGVLLFSGFWTPGSEKWTARDLVDHLNAKSKGKRFKLVNADGNTYITDADEYVPDAGALWYDPDSIKVVRHEDAERARLASGSLSAGRAWRWNHFVFHTNQEYADTGVSRRIKDILHQ